VNPRYLLDTSVFSQPLRNKPVLRSLERWQAAGDARCRVSAVSVAEVEFGLHLEASSGRWQKYDALLRGRLEVLPTGSEVWEEFARRKARQHKLGRVVADLDLLIAATATHHGLIVATLNAKDFQKIDGLAWESWAE
jgi:predicted nucleic acid-binding protein